jgi:hypothetical protein
MRRSPNDDLGLHAFSLVSHGKSSDLRMRPPRPRRSRDEWVRVWCGVEGSEVAGVDDAVDVESLSCERRFVRPGSPVMVSMVSVLAIVSVLATDTS